MSRSPAEWAGAYKPKTGSQRKGVDDTMKRHASAGNPGSAQQGAQGEDGTAGAEEVRGRDGY